MLGGHHFTQNRSHQITNRFIEFIAAGAKQLEQALQRRLSSYGAEHAGGVQLPGPRRLSRPLHQRLHRALARSTQQSHHAFLRLFVAVIQQLRQQGNGVTGLDFFTVTQRIVFQYWIWLLQNGLNCFHHRSAVYFKSARNEQRSAALFNCAFFNQCKKLL